MTQPGLTPPAGITSNFENPGQKGVAIFTVFINAFGIPIVTALVATRFYMRHRVSRDIGIDDICCLLGYIFYVGYCAIDLVFLQYGGGLHQWDVAAWKVPHYMKACYATMVIYGPAAFFTRCAILLFLTRIFSPVSKYCKFIYAVIGVMAAYYTLMVFLKAFICRPVAKFWIPDMDGVCFDQRSLILTDNVISLVSDVAVLFIPCPLVGSLKLDRKAKIRVGTVFGAGGIACVCSLVRLVEIVRDGGSKDETWAFTWINGWGILEVAVGLACACFPMVAMAWKHFRAPAKGSRARNDSAYDSGRYEMHSRTKNPVRTTVLDSGSDENILINNDPDSAYVANIRGGAQTPPPRSIGSGDSNRTDDGDNGARQSNSEELGITRTVDISVHETKEFGS